MLFNRRHAHLKPVFILDLDNFCFVSTRLALLHQCELSIAFSLPLLSLLGLIISLFLLFFLAFGLSDLLHDSFVLHLCSHFRAYSLWFTGWKPAWHSSMICLIFQDRAICSIWRGYQCQVIIHDLLLAIGSDALRHVNWPDLLFQLADCEVEIFALLGGAQQNAWLENRFTPIIFISRAICISLIRHLAESIWVLLVAVGQSWTMLSHFDYN